MKPLYCPYCGHLLEEGCTCAIDAEEERRERIEEIEERQHKSGMYVQEDIIAMYRFER